jgi:DNA-binding response OmpR family regulator
LSLKDEGYELHEAQNGEEAINVANKVKPDLVILDLMMPDKWGYDVCEELKSNPDTKNAVVIFLTARESRPSKKLGEIKGGNDFMVKPFSPVELRDKVRKLLGLS